MAVKRTVAPEPNVDPKVDDKDQTLNKTSPETGKKGFLRDRIAKRKEAELKEFGEEDDANKPVNELEQLTAEDVSEFSLYRESYMLTVTESPLDIDDTSSKDNSFDVTQMSNGQFESFAEVILYIHTQPIPHISTDYIL